MANIKVTAKEEAFVKSMHKMSGAVGTLAANINNKLTRSYSVAAKEQRELRRGMGRWAKGIESTGRALTYGITLPLLAMGGASLKAYGDIEALRIGLVAIEGSTQKAGEGFDRIRELAKLPGLGFFEAAQGYTNLRALGFGAEFAEKTLSSLGNALALGGKGKKEFTNVINQFTQMSSKAKVMMEDLKPILNSAPTIAKAVKELYGTVSAGDISKILETQGKGPAEFVEDLVGAMSKLPKAGNGVKNTMENFSDNMLMAAADIGEVINASTGAKEVIENFGQAVADVAAYFKSLSPAAQDSIIAIGGFAVALGPVLIGVGSLAKFAIPLLTGGFAALLNPVVLVTGALVAAGAVYIQHTQKVKELENAMRGLREIEDAAYASRDEQIRKVNTLIGVINNESVAYEQKKTALNELKAINPEYFGGLDLEKSKTEDVTQAVRNYANNLYRLAKAKGIVEQLNTNRKTQEELFNDPNSGLSYWEKLQINAGTMMGGMMGGDDTYSTYVQNLTADRISTLKDAEIELLEELDNFADVLYPDSPKTKKTPDYTNSDEEEKKLQKHNKAIEAFAIRQMERRDKLKELLAPQDIEIFKIDRATKSTEAIETLSDAEMIAMEEAQTKLLNKAKELKAAKQEAIKDSFNVDLNGIGIDLIGDAFEGMFDTGGFEKAMKSMLYSLGGALQQVGKQYLIAEKSIAFMKKSFGSGPWGALAAIAAGGVIKGLASNIEIPKLASGGTAIGPQIAMIGDNSSGIEHILPQENLPRFMEIAANLVNSKGGGGGQVIIPDMVVKGSDLHLIFNRYQRNM